MKFYIYKITNNINNKCYIGFTNNFKSRMSTHKSNSLSGKDNYKLYNSIRKYGWNNFTKEILFESEDKYYTLLTMEQKFIEMFDSIDNGYNMTEGGGKFPVYYGDDNPSSKRKGKCMSEFFSEDQIVRHKKSMKKAHSGKNNTHAREFKIIDPIGNVYNIHGKLKRFAQEKELSFSSLFSYINKGKIPKISSKSRNHKQGRLNLIGWEIQSIR